MEKLPVPVLAIICRQVPRFWEIGQVSKALRRKLRSMYRYMGYPKGRKQCIVENALKMSPYNSIPEQFKKVINSRIHAAEVKRPTIYVGCIISYMTTYSEIILINCKVTDFRAYTNRVIIVACKIQSAVIPADTYRPRKFIIRRSKIQNLSIGSYYVGEEWRGYYSVKVYYCRYIDTLELTHNKFGNVELVIGNINCLKLYGNNDFDLLKEYDTSCRIVYVDKHFNWKKLTAGDTKMEVIKYICYYNGSEYYQVCDCRTKRQRPRLMTPEEINNT